MNRRHIVPVRSPHDPDSLTAIIIIITLTLTTIFIALYTINAIF